MPEVYTSPASENLSHHHELKWFRINYTNVPQRNMYETETCPSGSLPEQPRKATVQPACISVGGQVITSPKLTVNHVDQVMFEYNLHLQVLLCQHQETSELTFGLANDGIHIMIFEFDHRNSFSVVG